ncbi:MAG: caspase family protein [Rhizonema sp. NSF051]|nr:caspase family protein [Rhizonema sp. NSF051]
MKRRTFLQRLSFILAVLGVTEAEWLTLGSRYYQALAQSKLRKLALLVGVNQYPQPALTGCLMDVELQRELLIHRFGFQSSDILCLTNEQATRESIETAFLEHLVKVARSDDVVVFHFSGYGSRVKLETLPEIVNALVPFDPYKGNIVNYLLEETLEQMLQSLATNRITAVLDTSYDAPTNIQPTGLRSRTRRTPAEAILAAGELEFQKQLQPKNGVNPVVLLAASSKSQQLATEIQLSGFSAGLFTYALTQYLWEAIPATTIQVSLSHAASSLQQLGSQQQPGLSLGKKSELSDALLNDIFLPDSTVGAQGVVTAIEEDGKTVQLWLGGIPLQVLEYYGVNSQFTLHSQERTTAPMVLRSRIGLTAKALVYGNSANSPKVGQLVTEAVRVFARNISLTVALDTKLERIERVDATSAFATVAYASSVVAGEQAADYVFGKLPEANNKDKTSTLVSSSRRYGLFTLSSELIPNTDGESGEAVKVAVQRLSPKLQTLLAAKLWRLTENEGSSRLGIKASLEDLNSLVPRILMQRETSRTQQGERKTLPTTQSILTVPIGSRIQYRVQNTSDRPVYIMLLGLNSSRTAIGLCPWQKNTLPENPEAKSLLFDVMIAPGESRTIPQTTSGFEWVVQAPASLSETQLIFSTAPFTQTLAALETAKHPTAEQHRIQPLINPLEVAQAVLQDLHNASNKGDNSNTVDFYTLNVNNWASLSFVYQVV